MTKIVKKLASIFLAVVMAVTFMPVLGTQSVYAAPGTDTITKVVLSFPAGFSINEAFKEGDEVEQFEISIRSVESVNGQVNTKDLLFDSTDYYGWCQSYDSGSGTDWIKYSEDGVQGLEYTAGESRFMVCVYVDENVDAVFADDCEFYVYDEPMTLYKRNDDKDVVFYISREAVGLTGSVGDDVSYAIDLESGTLQISGTGPMKNYGNSVFSPLNPYSYYIKSIIVGEGVTSIGSCSISGMYNCTSVTLPDTLKSLGWAAFSGYTSLKEIALPASLTKIESYAFYNTGLETINYPGTMEQWQNISISENGNEILSTDALNVQGHEHNFVVTRTVPATCGSDGYVEYTCDCGSVYQEKTEDATGNHTYNTDDVCTVCGAIKLPDPDARSGKCGENVTWSFDEESGVLTISGTGPMKDYGNSIYSPFAPFNYLVKSVVIEEGVTRIGSCSTSSLYYCTSVSLPSTLESLGWAAFANYNSLKEITLPASLTEIEDHSFANTSLEKINFMGTKEQWDAITIKPNGNEILSSLGAAGLHYWGEGTVTKEANCGVPGTRIYTCSECPETRTEVIPATGDHVYKTTIRKATLTENGSIKEACEVCKNEIISTIYFPKTFDLSETSYTYTGKENKPVVTVKDAEGNTIDASDYNVVYSNNVKVGNAAAKVTLLGEYYEGTKTLTFKIDKAANPLKISARTATVKYSKLKKKTQTLTVSKVIKFTKKGQGKMTYTKSSGNKKITINKTTGKVTVKKGLKKGTYKVKVKVKAAGNSNYKASSVKTVTFIIKVK